jgi:dethiobiotin synthetase
MFITGTDTNVGKTVVSAIFMAGLDADYWKPIQSGTTDGTDSEWIQQVTGFTADRFIPERYRLSAPLSPHAAADIDKVHIDLDEIFLPDTHRSVIDQEFSPPMIVEGAGGIMVPLNDKDFMVDLIKKLRLPTIVVARSSLGTINHTVLTVNKLREEGVHVLGVIMNGLRNEVNRKAIEHYAQVKVLAEIEQISALSKTALESAFERSFSREMARQ